MIPPTLTKKVGVAGLSLSLVGVLLVQQFEGYSEKVYRDVAGIPTVCTGVVTPLKVGTIVTADFCAKADHRGLAVAEAGVRRLVRVPLSQGQFDATVSLTYNIGVGALGGSTLLRKLNARDYKGACAEFSRWNRARVGGELRVVHGLTKRRAVEREMCEYPL